MIKITIKYEDIFEARIIQISDTDIQNEDMLVSWILNSMWNDCYLDKPVKTPYFYRHSVLCAAYFDLCYKVYNILDWYDPSIGWTNTDSTYCTIEVV